MIPSGFDYQKKAGRAEYLRASLTSIDTGECVIQIHGRKGAGVISSLIGADGLVEIPLDVTTVKQGQKLRFLPFRERVL